MSGDNASKTWKCRWEIKMFIYLYAKDICHCATYDIDIFCSRIVSITICIITVKSFI